MVRIVRSVARNRTCILEGDPDILEWSYCCMKILVVKSAVLVVMCLSRSFSISCFTTAANLCRQQIQMPFDASSFLRIFLTRYMFRVVSSLDPSHELDMAQAIEVYLSMQPWNFIYPCIAGNLAWIQMRLSFLRQQSSICDKNMNTRVLNQWALPVELWEYSYLLLVVDRQFAAH